MKIKWQETELVLDGNDGSGKITREGWGDIAPSPTPHAITCYNARPLTTTTSTRLWRPAVLAKTRVWRGGGGGGGSQSRGLRSRLFLSRDFLLHRAGPRIAIYDIQPQKEGRRS